MVRFPLRDTTTRPSIRDTTARSGILVATNVLIRFIFESCIVATNENNLAALVLHEMFLCVTSASLLSLTHPNFFLGTMSLHRIASCHFLYEYVSLLFPKQLYNMRIETVVGQFLDRYVGTTYLLSTNRKISKKLPYRPDKLYYIRSYDKYVMVEVDERQHKYYCPLKEEIRELSIIRELGKVSIIRFNPHVYNVRGIPRNIPLPYRIDELFKVVAAELSIACTRKIKLYYDSDDDTNINIKSI